MNYREIKDMRERIILQKEIGVEGMIARGLKVIEYVKFDPFDKKELEDYIRLHNCPF